MLQVIACRDVLCETVKKTDQPLVIAFEKHFHSSGLCQILPSKYFHRHSVEQLIIAGVSKNLYSIIFFFCPYFINRIPF